MKRAQRLEPLQHLASTREEQAVKRFVDAQRVVAEREARLRELEGYLADYHASATGTGGSVMLLNRHAFLLRLREAVSFQARSLEQARAAVEQERQRWIASRRQVQVLEQLARTYHAREQLEHERRNQKHMDEFATRRHLDAAARTDDDG